MSNSRRCKLCLGNGRKICFNCGGSGKTYVMIENKYTPMPCKVCDGYGRVVCPECKGTGKVLFYADED